jgi:cyclohexadieny/prephenate dehydrogenase
VRKTFDINSLDHIALIGVGLLGGSVGLALRAAGFTGTRVGIGRRQASLDRAVAADAVDEVSLDPAEGVAGARLVVVCTPISQFEAILRAMAPALQPGTYVTDVASAKGEVVRLAGRLLPRGVRFVGSHPMAGSEKTGVEYARADLFERALCLLTPTARTAPATVRWVQGFWESLGARTQVMSPRRHDTLLARASHLPHAVAAAIIHLARRGSAIDVAGPGFADTTRIASGDAAMWADIFRANREAMIQAVDGLADGLAHLRELLERGDIDAVLRWLDAARKTRDAWMARRWTKKTLPP